MKTGRAISAIKLAAMSRATVELAESLGAVPGAVLRAGKGALRHTGDIGEAVARGAGHDPKTGRLLAQGGLLVGGAYAARRGSDRYENWKYQHGFYTGG